MPGRLVRQMSAGQTSGRRLEAKALMSVENTTGGGGGGGEGRNESHGIRALPSRQGARCGVHGGATGTIKAARLLHVCQMAGSPPHIGRPSARGRASRCGCGSPWQGRQNTPSPDGRHARRQHGTVQHCTAQQTSAQDIAGGHGSETSNLHATNDGDALCLLSTRELLPCCGRKLHEGGRAHCRARTCPTAAFQSRASVPPPPPSLLSPLTC